MLFEGPSDNCDSQMELGALWRDWQAGVRVVPKERPYLIGGDVVQEEGGPGLPWGEMGG